MVYICVDEETKVRSVDFVGIEYMYKVHKQKGTMGIIQTPFGIEED
jgi:hypothetical protein